MNKIDLVEDTELHDLVEMEVRELLTEYQFDGDNATVNNKSFEFIDY
jgi:elongation factor Tu